MSNGTIFKITVQGLGHSTENCLLIKEVDKYIYKHIIMYWKPAFWTKKPLNYWDLNEPDPSSKNLH